jgi:hypothetical protein
VASCAQVDSLIQACLDDELSPAEKAIFARHLDECRQCRATLERQRANAAMLYEAMRPHKLTRDLTPGIMAHLPELESSRRVRELNEKTKASRGRLNIFYPILSVVAPLLLAVLGLAIFYSWPTEKNHHGLVVGMITAAEGTILHSPENSTEWRRIGLQTKLATGDRIETMADGRAMISLANTTAIKTHGSALFTIRDERNLNVEKGLLWLNVGKAARKFRVQTPSGDITVFGTTFTVEVDDQRTIVTLRTGKVTAGNDIDFTVLSPDQQITLVKGQSIGETTSVDAARLMAWADGLEADTAAAQAFAQTALPPSFGIIPAEMFYRCDARGQIRPTAIGFEWKNDGITTGHCSYDVFVYDESWTPLFRMGPISGNIFSDQRFNTLTLSIPPDITLENKVVYLMLVPDETTGLVETSFTRVYAVNNTHPDTN